MRTSKDNKQTSKDNKQTFEDNKQISKDNKQTSEDYKQTSKDYKQTCKNNEDIPRAAVVHLNFRSGSTFPVPVCTVPNSIASRCNKVDAVRLYASYRLNLLLPKGQICVIPRRLKCILRTQVDKQIDIDRLIRYRFKISLLQVENMCALVEVGEDWFGFIYSWSDTKKKSSLMLSILEPGNMSVPWLGSINRLGTVSFFHIFDIPPLAPT